MDETLSNDDAIAMLPDRQQVGVFRDNLDRKPPYHAWWDRADCVVAIQTHGAARDNRITGHTIRVQDACGLLYFEVKS